MMRNQLVFEYLFIIFKIILDIWNLFEKLIQPTSFLAAIHFNFSLFSYHQ